VKTQLSLCVLRRYANIDEKLRSSDCSWIIVAVAMVILPFSPLPQRAFADTYTTPFGQQQLEPALLSGSTGLIKNGGGHLLLQNPSNSYTGNTTINDGLVSITSAGALGLDPSPIVITSLPLNGILFDTTQGGGGGSLSVGGGITFSRAINMRGFGPSGQGGALISVGNNTFSGPIITSASTFLFSTYGTANLSGPLTLAAGTTNLIGQGNWRLSGAIGATTGGINKAGGGSLELTNTNLYSGTTAVSGGFLRVASSSSLGTSTSTTAILLGSGTLEIRSDAPNFSTKGLRVASSTSDLFMDHAVGSSVMNQTAQFRNLSVVTNAVSPPVATVNGRNGYGVNFLNAMVGGNLAGDNTITNNSNGLVNFNGSFWNQTNTTAARTFTLDGNGSTQINGNIIAPGSATFFHNIIKTGTGTLTILANGAGSNYTGLTNINGGTLAINSITALNNAATGVAGQINIGTTNTAGTLNFVGSGSAADYVVAKTLNLAGTTGGATISANQAGINPVVLNANFTATSGTGVSKTLTFGGTNTADNKINGIIPNDLGGGLVNLAKSGAGTWVLAGANSYTGNTTINDGKLKIQANAATSTVISDTSNFIFNTNGGMLELVGQASTNNVETLGELTPTAGASTVTLSPGAGGTASLVFTDTVGGSTTGLGAVNNSAGVNFVASGAGNTVTLAGVANGFVDPHLSYNGSNFAVATGGTGVLAAANYADPGFATSATVLTNAAHNEVTGSFSQAAETTRSLKINGNQTLNLTGLLTVNSQGLTTAATSAGGILQTGGTGVITGTGISTGGSGNLPVRVDGASDSLTLSAPITATTGGLTKNGPGTLVLNATNAQTGQTTINEGTLQLSGTATLSAANQNLVVRRSGTLDLNGFSTGTSIAAFNGEGSVINSNATAATLTVGNNNGTGTFDGVINQTSGEISVIKQGTGTQTWSGLNTYTGSTTINSTGLLSVTTLANGDAPSSIGQSSSAASNLLFGGASATQAFGGLNYTGSASISTDRLFSFTGTAANSGARIQANGANNATLVWSNTGPLAFGTVDVAQGLTLGGASSGDNTFSPQITNNGAGLVSVYKADAGLWILGNSGNSYTGNTRIVNGMLQAVDGASLPAASTLVIGTGSATSDAIFQSSGTFTRSLGTGAGQVAFLGTGSSTDAGFAASTGKLSVNIGGGSTLTWGAANTFGKSTSRLLLNSTTALSEVEIQNPIALNGASRTIEVLDNTNAGTDFATISGVISGTGSSGIFKLGDGTLSLTGANTYQGNTQIGDGDLQVLSLGQSTGVGTSSVGAWGSGAVIVNLGDLSYVGAGETSSRNIQIGGGVNNMIRSDGTGALILSNVTNIASASPKFAVLAGENTGPNEITNVLADNGAALRVQKSGSGTWILSGQNTHTGGTLLSGGLLGIGADTTGPAGAPTSGPLGVGALSLSNGSIAAIGADRTIKNLVSNSSGTAGFQGDHAITFDGNIPSVSSRTFNNFIEPGKALIINGQLSYDSTAASQTATHTFAGSGATIINGLIDEAAGSDDILGLTLNATGGGSLTLSGANGYTGPTNVTAGTLSINGDHSGATGAVNVASLATLGGTGRVGGATTISGTHAPGNSAGIQKFMTGLEYLTSSKLSWELLTNSDSVADRGIQYDGVDIEGGILLINTSATSSLVFDTPGSIVDWNDPFWSMSHQWLVFDNQTASPLANVFGGSITLSNDAQGDALPSSQGNFQWMQGGNDVFLTYSVVPEPSGALLLILSFLGLDCKRVKRIA
jgi:autotransporter-associated beta strand protein